MHILLLIAMLLAAAPAAAQDAVGREAELRMQLELFRMRDIEQSNRLLALEAQVRTEQAIRQVEAQRISPVLPEPDPRGPPSRVGAGGFVSIPDDRLAASNARVREASKPAR